ncbi:MAG: metal-sensing transcriptional repressor [Clostridia bacterium]|jgi:DNA-binding FrmR family transcriptional regulator|nr:metal-sensing transcriptional repressor [Clostridia bacterium]MCI1999808.1 metal-sensing transcriptional repressor [Clostridia bacterium]MCI2014276.1 metal-sensing transcriptional repressor [Clostridia bacterium]
MQTHLHNEEDIKKILNRISRAIGHFEYVKKMVENGEDCSDVLIQLAAVKSAVNNIGKEILKEHLSHCIVEAVKSGDEEAVKDLNSAIDKFMK